MSKTVPPTAPNPFGDLGQMMGQFKLPGVDMGAIVASGRKDMEALLATNKAMLDSMQELGKRQAEVFAQAMQSAQESIQTFAAGGGLPDPAKQAELARTAYEKAVAEMKELGQMACKAQADAMTGITERAQQSVEALKKLGK